MREVLTLDRLRSMTPDEAAALLVYRRAGGGADLDASILAEWLALDPQNATAWDGAQAAWSDFDEGESDDILAALRADARQAGPKRRWSAPWVAAAAVVLLTLGGLLAISLPHAMRGTPGQSQVAETQAAGTTYVAASNGVEVHVLGDGTRMTLAADSKATVVLTAARREVRLDRGRGYFDVAHDAHRPFDVSAGGQEIIALGTQFDVQLQPDQLRVVLVEGSVSVGPTKPGAKVTVLQPGQMLVARGGVYSVTPSADLGEVRRWRERYVVFDNVALAEVAKTLSKSGGSELIVRDPAVGAMRISGRFNADDVARFGQSVALAYPVRVVPRGERVWEIVAAP